MTPIDLAVFVDVDDTLVRSAGGKRIPMPATIAQVRALRAAGATLWCWSAGGAAYARETARELGIEAEFAGFLPKPNVFLDDHPPAQWPRCIHLGPVGVAAVSPAEVAAAVGQARGTLG